MEKEPYYLAYEKRYKKVFAAGIKRWGHTADDEALYSTISKWVNDNCLHGKHVIDFACGEGAGGEILSALGCVYHGVDISPSVLEKAKETLKQYPNASVSLLDMVNTPIDGRYDAATDIMGLHMLILDGDRAKYLKNAFNCLKNGAPMLFFRESFGSGIPESKPECKIETMEQWLEITGNDYSTPKIFTANKNGLNDNAEVKLELPLVPGRAKTKDGYIREMEEAGFIVVDFVEMPVNYQNPKSASVFVRKP